ncbi:metallophosphoesterase family protein [Niallia sp. FSL W8-0635]|uniref:metallophosphoesterase family protein n=1 Tax=Niallia sp. FSL W8-0635 TaxID=2975337 RepID=UPI0009CF4B13|nr:exonuclease subunit SbcD [Mycobacteroides abscessus subsp. abscessus]HEO8421496.1 DNA repair exonuclease [Yersinia enterocolitica]
MELSFIHCADLHLDSPMVGLKNLPTSIHNKLKESTFIAFKKVIDTAINKKVDFMIIAGDIYDGEDRSIRAQIRFRDEMLRLKENQIEVYLVHGNHDHVNGNWVKIDLPNNVHVFPSMVTLKQFVKNNISVNLYGFSYETRHVKERKIDEYERREDANFHIGILHGNLEGATEHSAYAPFHVKDLLSKKMDYWALGHIHKREIVETIPPIVYPGNIQGRHKKETEVKGCYFVELSEGESRLAFIPTSEIIWESLIIDASSVHTFDDLYRLCREKIDEIRDGRYSYIISMEIKHLRMEDTFLDSDLLEILQQDEIDSDSFVWVTSLKSQENTEWLKENLLKESAFYEELFAVTENYEEIDKAVASLYQHPKAHRFLEELTVNEKQELAKEAEDLLLTMLVKSGR